MQFSSKLVRLLVHREYLLFLSFSFLLVNKYKTKAEGARLAPTRKNDVQFFPAGGL
jgi:hypothetical protein